MSILFLKPEITIDIDNKFFIYTHMYVHTYKQETQNKTKYKRPQSIEKHITVEAVAWPNESHSIPLCPHIFTIHPQE